MSSTLTAKCFRLMSQHIKFVEFVRRAPSTESSETPCLHLVLPERRPLIEQGRSSGGFRLHFCDRSRATQSSFSLCWTLPNRPLWAILLLIAIGVTAPGCMTARSMISFRQSDPMAGAPRFRQVNPRLDEVVAHLNRNTDRIQSWQAKQVKIHAQGVSIPLQGRLYVEKGTNFRLQVTSPMAIEVDIGSNKERFWVWSRYASPSFVTCKHENLEAVRQTEGIPFEPDWMMQAFGVEPIPSEDVSFETPPTNDEARLVQQVVTAHGIPLRRVVLVDLKNGGVVTEHSLYDFGFKRIARAKLSGHRWDKDSGAVLPHHVSLDWPQNKMAVTMELGNIIVNPKTISPHIWAMPNRPECEIVHLDADVRPSRVATSSSGNVYLDSIEEIPASAIESEWMAQEEEEESADDDSQAGRIRISSGQVEPERPISRAEALEY